MIFLRKEKSKSENWDNVSLIVTFRGRPMSFHSSHQQKFGDFFLTRLWPPENNKSKSSFFSHFNWNKEPHFFYDDLNITTFYFSYSSLNSVRTVPTEASILGKILRSPWSSMGSQKNRCHYAASCRASLQCQLRSHLTIKYEDSVINWIQNRFQSQLQLLSRKKKVEFSFS